ncbi:Conserved hypothetical protein [Yarrowia lipolytica]|nr:Conserved hypothetical protein [Yarrowia lipolytica]
MDSRKLALLCSFLVASGCGTMYVYSAYAPQLATRLHFNASESQIIGLCGTVGVSLLGIAAGIIIDKYGTTTPIVLGGVFLMLGYSLITLCYIKCIESVLLCALALMAAGFGSGMSFVASIKVCALNYPENRGTASSIPLAAFGLSAFLFSTIAGIFFPGNTQGFLILLTVLTSSLSLVLVPFVRVIPAISHAEDEALLDDGCSSSSCESVDIYGVSLFKSIDFWKHFLIIGCIAGCGQMYIYGCGYVIRALVGPDVETSGVQSFHVAMISLLSFCGRLLSGSISDVLTRYQYSRLWMIFISLALGLVGSFLATVVTEISFLWMVSLSFGLSYGFCYGVYPTIIAEMFGMTYFSQNWGYSGSSAVFSAYFFTTTFGKVFDSHSKGDVCYEGVNCYKSAFNMAFYVFAVFVVMILYMIHNNYQKFKQ